MNSRKYYMRVIIQIKIVYIETEIERISKRIKNTFHKYISVNVSIFVLLLNFLNISFMFSLFYLIHNYMYIYTFFSSH